MNSLVNNKIILGQEKQFDFDPRYFLATAERAMKGDVVRGLVELITNSDDSYGELELKHLKTSGEISISIRRRRNNKGTTITVSDKAEGMELKEMVEKLSRVGGITSPFIETKGVKTRGLMGRGSKECVVFGALTFRSIKNDLYSELKLKKPANYEPIIKRPATELDRLRLNLPKGNGTAVTLEVDSRFKIPLHKFLVDNLPKYYSLRDIAASPERKIELTDLSNLNRRKDSITYNHLQGTAVLDDHFNIPGFPKAVAYIQIFKSQDRIKVDTSSSYWEGGVLIQSNYAIHGVTGFTRDIENNPYFEWYFGRLKCPFIDTLAIEYELQERKNITHSADNPTRVIDPLRSEGLSKDHPFTQALYGEAIRRIRFLLKQEEKLATEKIKEIENRKTKERMKRLAGEVGKFIRSKIEELEDPEDDNYLENSEVPSGGMLIIPRGLRIPLGEAQKFYVYVKPSDKKTDKSVTISTDSKSVVLNSDKEGLISRGDGIFYTAFSVMGIEYEENIKLRVNWSGIEQKVSVAVVKKEVVHPHVNNFTFEKQQYKIRKGKRKEVLILAAWPQFIHGEVECGVTTDSDEFIEFTGKKTKLKHVIFDDGVEMGIGTIRIFGKKEGGPTIIKTNLQKKEISTSIIVLPSKDLGHDIEIKVVDEDLGEQRALWDGNLLKIAGRHKSISRYLGPSPHFSNQDSIHFRLLIAELIVDNVARRILELNSQKNIREYEDLDVSGFYSRHRKYVNEFLEIVHKIQINDSEIKSR